MANRRQHKSEHPSPASSSAGLQIGRRFIYIIGFLLTLQLLLSGCVTLRDPEASQEYRGDVVAVIGPERTVGQTFLSRRSGLNGVQLWLRIKPSFTSNDRLIVELYHSPDETLPLDTVAVPYSSLTNAFPLSVSFSPRSDPPQQSYYLTLKTTGGEIEVFGRAEDAYPWGEFYEAGGHRPGDASFRTSYDYNLLSFSGDLGKVMGHIWLVIPLMVLLWAPGRLLLTLVENGPWTSQERRLDWGERTALSIGLSLALIPLLMLWTTTLGLSWSRPAVLLFAGLFVAALAWQAWRRHRRATAYAPSELRQIDWISLGLAGVLLFALGIRLIMVRDLAAPAWVDSVHHAVITRLILDRGALPTSYAPLVETRTASYHPGFHTIVASFVWLTDLDLPSAMLWVGQVLNALSVLAVYLFTTSLTRDRIAGLIAALITGAFTTMPAYYASWGRYTQLTGLLVLPVCLALFIRLWDAPTSRKPLPALLLVTAVACAGLFIVHYRVIAFLALLLLAALTARTISFLEKAPIWSTFPKLMAPLVGVAFISVLLSLPWWPSFVSSMLMPQASIGGVVDNRFRDFSWSYLTNAYGRQLLYLAALGLAWSILRARWFGPTLALWVALLFGLANPGAFNLPGAALVNNTSVEIMLFIPISTLGGYLLAEIVGAPHRFLPGWGKLTYAASIGLVGIVLAFMGAKSLLPILNPITFLFRQADAPAIAWIQDNISTSETIFINPFLWGYGLYSGQDGGAWIPALAEHPTMPPPVLYGLGTPEHIQEVNRICQQAIEDSRDPQALFDLLQGEGINYIYLGRRGGAISPQALRNSPLFKLIYSHEGVQIFERQPINQDN
jgi:hypothetical protein